MDWTSSEIIHAFEYELIDPFDLEESLGFIEGVTGGTITEELSAEYFSKLSLKIDGEELPLGALVRVWHIAESGNERVREELGTFMQDNKPSLERKFGRVTGSVALYSTLYRLGKDLLPKDRAVQGGSGIVDHFEFIVRDAGGTPLVNPSIDRGKAFAEGRIWLAGDSVLSECGVAAEALGAKAGVDAHGRTTLEPYQLPSKRSGSFSILPGDASTTIAGVSISRSDWRNCVAVSCEVDDVRYFCMAKVDESHPLHFRKVGYWNTEHVTISSIEEGADPQSVVDAEGAAKLAELSETVTTYSTEMCYRPIACGEVGEFWYQDSDEDEGIYVKGMVTQREIDLEKSMKMKLTIEEVA